jgi:hypothetical protein
MRIHLIRRQRNHPRAHLGLPKENLWHWIWVGTRSGASNYFSHTQPNWLRPRTSKSTYAGRRTLKPHSLR